MSSSQQATPLVGLRPKKHNFGIRIDPLDWKELKGMKEEERNAEIIKRANLYTYYQCPPGVGIRAWREQVDNAKKEPYKPSSFEEIKSSYSTVRSKVDILVPPLDKLAEWFPKQYDELNHRIGINTTRQKINPFTSVLALQFGATIMEFQSTALCREVKKLVRKLFQEKKINKIVAFGLGMLGVHAPPHAKLTIRWQRQHATLLAIRDVWKETNMGNFDIFIQDPQYSKQDEEVATQYGMTVVNCDLGYQMGWLLIDEETLLVNFVASFEVDQLAFEITRPAALFYSAPIQPKYYKDEPVYSYTLRRYNEKLKTLEMMVVPGLGIDSQTAVREALEEYRVEKLNLDGLDIGERPKEPEPEPPRLAGPVPPAPTPIYFEPLGTYADGEGQGTTYIGYHPTLYTRKA